MLEQPQVLRVAGFEKEAHGLDRGGHTFFFAVSPKMPEGLSISTASTTT
jgi:hypothetical protein